MRKTRALVLAGFGAWLGWRLRERFSALDSYRGVGRSGADPEIRLSSFADGIRSGEAVEKAKAIVELGRERGRDLLRQLLGGRAA